MFVKTKRGLRKDEYKDERFFTVVKFEGEG